MPRQPGANHRRDLRRGMFEQSFRQCDNALPITAGFKHDRPRCQGRVSRGQQGRTGGSSSPGEPPAMQRQQLFEPVDDQQAVRRFLP